MNIFKEMFRSYNWWRRDGHSCSVLRSIRLTFHCVIWPWILTPYYLLSIKYYSWKSKKYDYIKNLTTPQERADKEYGE